MDKHSSHLHIVSPVPRGSTEGAAALDTTYFLLSSTLEPLSASHCDDPNNLASSQESEAAQHISMKPLFSSQSGDRPSGENASLPAFPLPSLRLSDRRMNHELDEIASSVTRDGSSSSATDRPSPSGLLSPESTPCSESSGGSGPFISAITARTPRPPPLSTDLHPSIPQSVDQSPWLNLHGGCVDTVYGLSDLSFLLQRQQHASYLGEKPNASLSQNGQLGLRTIHESRTTSSPYAEDPLTSSKVHATVDSSLTHGRQSEQSLKMPCALPRVNLNALSAFVERPEMPVGASQSVGAGNHPHMLDSGRNRALNPISDDYESRGSDDCCGEVSKPSTRNQEEGDRHREDTELMLNPCNMRSVFGDAPADSMSSFAQSLGSKLYFDGRSCDIIQRNGPQHNRTAAANSKSSQNPVDPADATVVTGLWSSQTGLDQYTSHHEPLGGRSFSFAQQSIDFLTLEMPNTMQGGSSCCELPYQPSTGLGSTHERNQQEHQDDSPLLLPVQRMPMPCKSGLPFASQGFDDIGIDHEVDGITSRRRGYIASAPHSANPYVHEAAGLSTDMFHSGSSINRAHRSSFVSTLDLGTLPSHHFAPTSHLGEGPLDARFPHSQASHARDQYEPMDSFKLQSLSHSHTIRRPTEFGLPHAFNLQNPQDDFELARSLPAQGQFSVGQQAWETEQKTMEHSNEYDYSGQFLETNRPHAPSTDYSMSLQLNVHQHPYPVSSQPHITPFDNGQSAYQDLDECVERQVPRAPGSQMSYSSSSISASSLTAFPLPGMHLPSVKYEAAGDSQYQAENAWCQTNGQVIAHGWDKQQLASQSYSADHGSDIPSESKFPTRLQRDSGQRSAPDNAAASSQYNGSSCTVGSNSTGRASSSAQVLSPSSTQSGAASGSVTQTAASTRARRGQSTTNHLGVLDPSVAVSTALLPPELLLRSGLTLGSASASRGGRRATTPKGGDEGESKTQGGDETSAGGSQSANGAVYPAAALVNAKASFICAVENRRKYLCRVCGKQFTQRGGLHIHMRIHLGQKPFVCETCGAAFSQACNLKRHCRSHTGERPHACLQCGKRFNRKWSLEKHYLTHMKAMRSGLVDLANSISPQAFAASLGSASRGIGSSTNDSTPVRPVPHIAQKLSGSGNSANSTTFPADPSLIASPHTQGRTSGAPNNPLSSSPVGSQQSRWNSGGSGTRFAADSPDDQMAWKEDTAL